MTLRRISLSGLGLSYLPDNIFRKNLNLKCVDMSNNNLKKLTVSINKLVKLLWIDINKDNIHI